MFNYRRIPQRHRKNCWMQADFRQPREDVVFHSSVSQCSLHQESLCKVSDYEISPSSKYNLPEICCCDSRGRAIYWLYKHNLADGECVRKTKFDRPTSEKPYNVPSGVQSVCAECSLSEHRNIHKQLLKLRDMIITESNSDIRITETHNSYINLGDIETFHILLSEDNLCHDRYHNLMMNLEIKHKLLEEAHRKFSRKYNTFQQSDNHIGYKRTKHISADNLESLFSVESFYESNILSGGVLKHKMNELDHILNQLNFFIKSKKMDDISDAQKRQLAKYLEIITEKCEDGYRNHGKHKSDFTSRIDQILNEPKPSVLELTKSRFDHSSHSEIEIDSHQGTINKNNYSAKNNNTSATNNNNNSTINNNNSAHDFNNITTNKNNNTVSNNNTSNNNDPSNNNSNNKPLSNDSNNNINPKKISSSNMAINNKKCHLKDTNSISNEKPQIGSIESIVNNKKPSQTFHAMEEPKKSRSIDLKNDSEKELPKRSREKSKHSKRNKKSTEESKELERPRKTMLKAESGIQRDSMTDVERTTIRQLLREKELERLRVEEKEKEIQILKELLKEKERKIAEEEVKEKQILKELLREKEKRKREEEEERLLLEEILKEKEKKKAEDVGREKRRLRQLIREKEKIVVEEKLKEKEKRRKEKLADKEKKEEELGQQKPKAAIEKEDATENDPKKSSDKEPREKETKARKSKSVEKTRKHHHKESVDKEGHKDVLHKDTNDEGKRTNSDGRDTNSVERDTNTDGKCTNSDGKYTNSDENYTNSDGKYTSNDEKYANSDEKSSKDRNDTTKDGNYKTDSDHKHDNKESLKKVHKDKTSANLRNLIKENHKEIMKENLKEMIKEYHKEKGEIKKDDRHQKDRVKKSCEKTSHKSRSPNMDIENVCEGVPIQINLNEKNVLSIENNKANEPLDRVDSYKIRPKFATCLTDPPACSSSRLFSQQMESLEKIPEEETVKGSLKEENRFRKKSLKIDQSVMVYQSLIKMDENKNKKENSVKENGKMVDAGVETEEVGASIKPPQLKFPCFPAGQEDLFHLSKSKLQEMDVKNIKEDPRFRSPKKITSEEFFEKAVQIPSNTDKGLHIESSKTTISKYSLPYEETSNERFHIDRLFNTAMGDHRRHYHKESKIDIELGTELEGRSIPTTPSCYSNHIVSIKDSLLHLDDGKIFEVATPKMSKDDLAKTHGIAEQRAEPDILSISNGIPIYKEGFEIARITNQTPSCFSTIKRYARVNKSTQMFEHVTSNDLYTLKWIHDNLFEIDINPHTLIVDEKIKEISEMSGVS